MSRAPLIACMALVGFAALVALALGVAPWQRVPQTVEPASPVPQPAAEVPDTAVAPTVNDSLEVALPEEVLAQPEPSAVPPRYDGAP